MVRVALQSFLTVADRIGEVLAHVAHRSTLVPSLSEVGHHLDHLGESVFSVAESSLLHRLHTDAENEIHLPISRATPNRPQHRFSGRSQLGVIALQSDQRFFFIGGIHGSLRSAFKSSRSESL